MVTTLTLSLPALATAALLAGLAVLTLGRGRVGLPSGRPPRPAPAQPGPCRGIRP